MENKINEVVASTTNKKEDKNKKRKILMGTLIPIGVLAAAAAIVTPTVIACKNKGDKTEINEMAYDTASKKYASSYIIIKPNSTLTFNIKIVEDGTNGVVLPQTFKIEDDQSNLVSITNVSSVMVNGETYTSYTLSDDKIDLGDLSKKGLTKDSTIKITLTTANKGDVKAKALCEPIAELKYINISANKAFKFSVNSKNWDGQLDYSTNEQTWTEKWDGTTTVYSTEGTDKKHHIYLRGLNNTSFMNEDSGNYTKFKFDAESSEGDKLEVSFDGNIMTLLDYNNLDSVELGKGCFYSLFEDCKALVSAPKLPATKLTNYCYYGMFKGCSSLKKAPELPAEELVYGCYSEMFKGCTSLTTTPNLPAKNLVLYCYQSMFNGCSGLTSVGKFGDETGISITGNSSCQSMFEGCSNLLVQETAESSDAFLTINSIEKADSVKSMFSNCKSGSITSDPIAGGSYKFVKE